MKKLKRLFLFLFLLLGLGLQSFAEETGQDTLNKINKKVNPIILQLMKKNNFSKSYTVYPFISASKNTVITSNGVIQFPSAAYDPQDNVNLTAATLAMLIGRVESGAIGKSKIKQSTVPFFGKAWCKSDVYVSDLLAVEYLVKAGYNPVALEVVLLRVGGDASAWGEFWSAFPNVSHRAEYVHKYISVHYPKYFSDSKEMEYYKSLMFVPCLENELHYVSMIEIKPRYLLRVKKLLKKQGYIM